MNADNLVFIALGSNQGPSPRLVRDAMGRLESWSAQPLRRSSLWRTQPVHCPPGSGCFINAVVALLPHAQETPRSLLRTLQALETEFGRKISPIRNAPRRLDLDIIAWGSRLLDAPDLVLPHPRACQRRFVLAPLAELAPQWILPGQTESVAALLARMKGEADVRRLVS